MIIELNNSDDMEDLFDYLNNLNARTNMVEQISDEWVKKHSVAFARAGVFNPYTLQGWTRVLEKMKQGIPPVIREHWYMDQWGHHPIRLMRSRGKLVRKSRIKWTYSLENSPLYLTPHALARFRQHTGTFVDPDTQCWDIPHITQGVELTDSELPVTSNLLPTKHGAWLGYPTVMRGTGNEVYFYSRNQGLKLQPDSKNAITTQFYATTYILEDHMSKQQKDICEAYRAGDFDTYESLNKQNAKQYPTSIFEQ